MGQIFRIKPTPSPLLSICCRPYLNLLPNPLLQRSSRHHSQVNGKSHVSHAHVFVHMVVMLFLLSVNVLALDSTRIQIAFIVNGDTLDPIIDGNLEIDDEPVLSSSSARRDSTGVELSNFTEHKFRLTYGNARIEYCFYIIPIDRRLQFELTIERKCWLSFGCEKVSAKLLNEYHQPHDAHWIWVPLEREIPVAILKQ